MDRVLEWFTGGYWVWFVVVPVFLLVPFIAFGGEIKSRLDNRRERREGELVERITGESRQERLRRERDRGQEELRERFEAEAREKVFRETHEQEPRYRQLLGDEEYEDHLKELFEGEDYEDYQSYLRELYGSERWRAREDARERFLQAARKKGPVEDWDEEEWRASYEHYVGKVLREGRDEDYEDYLLEVLDNYEVADDSARSDD